MKKHNGMRPQDIVVLLKIIALKNDDWYNSELAHSLQISGSEISEVLNRCKIAGLIDSKKRKVHINSFIEFLIYGLIDNQPYLLIIPRFCCMTYALKFKLLNSCKFNK